MTTASTVISDSRRSRAFSDTSSNWSDDGSLGDVYGIPPPDSSWPSRPNRAQHLDIEGDWEDCADAATSLSSIPPSPSDLFLPVAGTLHSSPSLASPFEALRAVPHHLDDDARSEGSTWSDLQSPGTGGDASAAAPSATDHASPPRSAVAVLGRRAAARRNDAAASAFVSLPPFISLFAGWRRQQGHGDGLLDTSPAAFSLPRRASLSEWSLPSPSQATAPGSSAFSDRLDRGPVV
ncbi:hypothetical protein HK405_007607, partial [Cladochytrium tenue]